MSKINYDASSTFKDILPLLIDNKGMIQYLDGLQIQTLQMKNKMSLKVNDSDTEDILKLKTSISSYLSEDVFKEQPTFKTYPATIKALKIDWILEEKNKDLSIESDGKKFLVAIGNSENDELFQIPSIKVLIEFLYIKYKKTFLQVGLPAYIMQLVIFFLMISINERQLTE